MTLRDRVQALVASGKLTTEQAAQIRDSIASVGLRSLDEMAGAEVVEASTVDGTLSATVELTTQYTITLTPDASTHTGYRIDITQ